MNIRRLCVLTFFVELLFSQEQTAKKVLTVCEVASSPSSYHNKTVSVKGAWIVSPEYSDLLPIEGDCLDGSGKPPSIALRRGAVAIEWPGRPGEFSSFKDKSPAERYKARYGWVALVTVTGRFVTGGIERDLAGTDPEDSGLILAEKVSSAVWVTRNSWAEHLLLGRQPVKKVP